MSPKFSWQNYHECIPTKNSDIIHIFLSRNSPTDLFLQNKAVYLQIYGSMHKNEYETLKTVSNQNKNIQLSICLRVRFRKLQILFFFLFLSLNSWKSTA